LIPRLAPNPRISRSCPTVYRSGEPLPVVLAAHNGVAVDFKLLVDAIGKGGAEPRRVLIDAGVVGFFDSLRFAKRFLRGLKSSSNRAVFEALVPTASESRYKWHCAVDDSSASADWLTTPHVAQLLLEHDVMAPLDTILAYVSRTREAATKKKSSRK
jgi:hypothetical protein